MGGITTLEKRSPQVTDCISRDPFCWRGSPGQAQRLIFLLTFTSIRALQNIFLQRTAFGMQQGRPGKPNISRRSSPPLQSPPIFPTELRSGREVGSSANTLSDVISETSCSSLERVRQHNQSSHLVLEV